MSDSTNSADAEHHHHQHQHVHINMFTSSQLIVSALTQFFRSRLLAALTLAMTLNIQVRDKLETMNVIEDFSSPGLSAHTWRRSS